MLWMALVVVSLASPSLVSAECGLCGDVVVVVVVVVVDIVIL